jgi:hypothetical protein
VVHIILLPKTRLGNMSFFKGFDFGKGVWKMMEIKEEEKLLVTLLCVQTITITCIGGDKKDRYQ